MEGEEPKPPKEEWIQRLEKDPRSNPFLGASYKEVAKNGSGSQASAWVDISDCLPKRDLGILKYCLVGTWRSQPDTFPSMEELD